MDLIADLGLAVAVFTSTNIDDIFVLIAFFSDRKMRPSQVVTGQFLGIASLVGISLVASLISLVLPKQYIGLLGLAPIAIGLNRLLALRRKHKDDAGPAAASVFAVAAVTIANGGDNIGVYTPMFATQEPPQTALTLIVFMSMTALWCWLGHQMVDHPTLGPPIQRWGTRVLPFVLIGLGVVILLESETLSLFGS